MADTDIEHGREAQKESKRAGDIIVIKNNVKAEWYKEKSEYLSGKQRIKGTHKARTWKINEEVKMDGYANWQEDRQETDKDETSAVLKLR